MPHGPIRINCEKGALDLGNEATWSAQYGHVKRRRGAGLHRFEDSKTGNVAPTSKKHGCEREETSGGVILPKDRLSMSGKGFC